jgi:heme/copper-type cytochrome/quinol oxidase subunit 3
MDNIIDNCWDYVKQHDTQVLIKEHLILPMKEAIYKEFFFYICMMYFYHILILIILIAILILTLKKYKSNI